MQDLGNERKLLSAIEGVLFTKDFLLKRKRTNDIIEQSKLKAKTEILTASVKSEDLKKRGYYEGYEGGILACLEKINIFLANLEKGSSEYIISNINILSEIIEEVTGKEQYIEKIIADWLKIYEKQEELTVEIRMHKKRVKLAAKIKQNLKLKGYCVNIHLDENQGYHFRTGAYILEFLPEEFSDILTRRIIEQNYNYPDTVSRLSEAFKIEIKNILTEGKYE